MKSIHDLEDSFADKNHPCLLPELYVFTLVRKHGVIRAVTPISIIPIQGIYSVDI